MEYFANDSWSSDIVLNLGKKMKKFISILKPIVH